MNKKIIISILVIILIGGCFLGTLSIASTQSELEDEQDNLNSQISETKDEIEEVQTALSETAQEVQELIEQISSYETSISELNTNISEKETEISNKESEINAAQAELEEKQDLLDKRLVALYESGQTSYIELLLSSADLTDFISKYYLISELATYDTELIEGIRTSKEELEVAKAELETVKEELETAKAELETEQNALESAKSEKETKAASLSEEEDTLTAELEELEAAESAVSSQIQSLKEEYEKQQKAAAAAAAAASSSSSSSTSSSSSSSSSSTSSSSSSSSSLSSSSVSSYGFGWPVANPVITTGYGVSGTLWSSGKHTGVDFKASTGTAVYSVGDGIVVDTGYSSSYGNYVEIYHGDNIYSYYAHNSSILVSTGDTVSRGTQISYSGATGNVTGPHLHFEIRTPTAKYSSCVNPIPYLP